MKLKTLVISAIFIFILCGLVYGESNIRYVYVNNPPPFSIDTIRSKMAVDGVVPISILEYKKFNFYDDDQDGVVTRYITYAYEYYGFYENFTDGKIFVSVDDEVVNIDGTEVNQSKYKILVSDSNYSKKNVYYFATSPANGKTGKYASPAIVNKSTISSDYLGFYTMKSNPRMGGYPNYLNFYYFDSTNKFVNVRDNSNFSQGQIQGLTMAGQPLATIPQMVTIAVVFLVGLMGLLILLKVLLKVLKIFLPT